MSTEEYQIRKKRREKFRKIVINFVVWVIIIAFVATIGVFWGDQAASGGFPKIVKVNRATYDYRPDSVFSHLHEEIRQGIVEQSRGLLDPDFVSRYSLSQTVQAIVNYAVIYDFGKSVGVEASQTYLRRAVEQIYGGRRVIPSEGMLDYLKIRQVNSAIAGNSGVVPNVFGNITVAELYSFFDIVNFQAVTDILYLNTTNFISRKIDREEIEGYYRNNANIYAREVYVDNIAVEERPLAVEMTRFIQTEGWDTALKEYEGKYTLIRNLTLKDERGLNRRYNSAIKMNPGEVLTNTQYEDGLYHIIRVNNFPRFASLDAYTREAITRDYIAENYSLLKSRYLNQIEEAIKTAEAMIVTGSSFNAVANTTGMSYIRTAPFSPVTDAIKDQNEETIQVPILNNLEWLDFVFTANKNEASPVFRTDDFAVILRVIERKESFDFSYEEIDEKVYLNYMRFKNYAGNSDWFNTIKNKANIVIYTNEIEELF
jgi:hypothetical protein